MASGDALTKCLWTWPILGNAVPS